MNSGNMSFVPFACVDCPGESQRYPTIDELEVHIASDHLNYCPYECERCRFAKFPTEYALVSHCKNDHGMKEFYVRYRYSLEGERKLTELKTKVRACLRQRLGATDDSMMVNLGNAISTLPASIIEKFENDPDSFPSSVDPSSSEPVNNNMNGSINIPPPSTSPNSIASHILQQHRHATPNIQQNLNGQGQASEMSMPHLLNPHGMNVGGMGSVSSFVGDLSPMDFASDAMSSGMDFAALIGEGEELVRKPKDVVTCQICGLKVSNQRSSLVYHANTKHIKLNLYQCAVCQKTWQTIAKSDVLKHVKAIHNGDESMIIDNRKRLGYQLRMFTARCFPPKPSNKAKPLTAGCSPPRPGGSAESDYNALAADSASQILQSFLAPRMDDNNGMIDQSGMEEHDDTGEDLDGDGEPDEGTAPYSHGDGGAMEAAIARMNAMSGAAQGLEHSHQC